MTFKCCNSLNHTIVFGFKSIQLCNRCSHRGGGNIVVSEYNDQENKNFDFKFGMYKKKRLEVLSYYKQDGVYPACEGCIELENLQEGKNSKNKLSNFVLHHWTKCNSHCIYCFTNESKKYFNTRKSYDFLPILKDIVKNKQLAYQGIVAFAGGEISCLDEFEDVLNIFKTYDYFVFFNSSAVEYEKSVSEFLSRRQGVLIVSLDAGNKETHKKIKQVDTFDKVVKNLKSYILRTKDINSIFLKYIFIKNVNDSAYEVLSFLELVKQLGCKNVIFDIDYNWLVEERNNIPKYLVDLFYFAYGETTKIGLNMIIYDNATVLFSESPLVDDFWKSRAFSQNDCYSKPTYKKVLVLDRKQNLAEFDKINDAAENYNIHYYKVKEACEKSSIGETVFIKGFIFAYKEDFLKKDSNGNILIDENNQQIIDYEKLVMLSKKKTKSIFEKLIKF